MGDPQEGSEPGGSDDVTVWFIIQIPTGLIIPLGIYKYRKGMVDTFEVIYK